MNEESVGGERHKLRGKTAYVGSLLALLTRLWEGLMGMRKQGLLERVILGECRLWKVPST